MPISKLHTLSGSLDHLGKPGLLSGITYDSWGLYTVFLGIVVSLCFCPTRTKFCKCFPAARRRKSASRASQLWRHDWRRFRADCSIHW